MISIAEQQRNKHERFHVSPAPTEIDTEKQAEIVQIDTNASKAFRIKWPF